MIKCPYNFDPFWIPTIEQLFFGFARNRSTLSKKSKMNRKWEKPNEVYKIDFHKLQKVYLTLCPIAINPRKGQLLGNFLQQGLVSKGSISAWTCWLPKLVCKCLDDFLLPPTAQVFADWRHSYSRHSRLCSLFLISIFFAAPPSARYLLIIAPFQLMMRSEKMYLQCIWRFDLLLLFPCPPKDTFVLLLWNQIYW